MTVLTTEQRDYFHSRFREISGSDAFEAEMVRRQQVSGRFRGLVEELRILEGGPVASEAMAKLVGLVWEIQNLNPIVLPQFLGTYTYYKHFKGFAGNEEAFAKHMEETRATWEPGSLGYPGVEGEVLGARLAALLKSEDAAFGRAYTDFVRLPGAARALTTGILILWNPKRFALVNNASIGPFRGKSGRLALSRAQRAQLRADAKARFGIPSDAKLAQRDLGWMVLMEELRSVTDAPNFFAVDWTLWQMTRKEEAKPNESGAQVDVDELIERGLARATQKRVQVRSESIAKARELIEKKLGAFEEPDIRALLELFNRDTDENGEPRRDRFSPAFVGSTANKIVAAKEAFNRWLEALWSARDRETVSQILDQLWDARDIPGAGRSLPTMLLHTKDPETYPPWTSGLARGYAYLAGLKFRRKRSGAAYFSYADGVVKLRQAYGVPAHGVDLVLIEAARAKSEKKDEEKKSTRQFTGFTEDAFVFLADLERNNSDAWFSTQRERFRRSVRDPVRALVTDLGTAFAKQVTLDLEATPNSPQTLARIRKNAWGTIDEPFWPHYWAAFHRPELRKTEDFQLFVYLRGDTFRWGMSTGSASREDLARFAGRLRSEAILARRALEEALKSGVAVCVDRDGSKEGEPLPVTTPEDLAERVEQKSISLEKALEPRAAASRGPDLLEDIEKVFRALYPLYVLAVSEDPRAELEALWDDDGNGDADEGEVYDRGALREETLLDEDEIDEVEALLEDKPQLILYGPPGTGKTWVAERIARYLTRDGGSVKVVQFHPSYGYEDFVEGIRPKLHDETKQLSYEVEHGVFRKLCEDARKKPNHRFVLIVDEINRGNLPRIFGELLYLLERRGKRVELPLSRKEFAVPKNVTIIGTMNTADQSIALIDVALRRRFHFLHMPPKPDLLKQWLEINAPEMTHVSSVLDKLNGALQQEGIDDNLLIGHSHFMRTGLDERSLRRIWERSILPTLEEYFYGKLDKAKRFDFEDFVEGELGPSVEAELDEDDSDEDEDDVVGS